MPCPYVILRPPHKAGRQGFTPSWQLKRSSVACQAHYALEVQEFRSLLFVDLTFLRRWPYAPDDAGHDDDGQDVGCRLQELGRQWNMDEGQ